jgi:uncharacterized protein
VALSRPAHPRVTEAVGPLPSQSFTTKLASRLFAKKEFPVLSGIKQYNQSAAKRDTLLFVIAFFAMWIVRVFIYKYFDMGIESKLLAALSSLSWKTLVWIGFPVFFLVRVEKKNPLEYLKLSAVNRKTVYWCLIIILVGIVWQFALWLLKLDAQFPDLRGIVLAIWGAGVCEEILFRGFLLQKFSEFMPFIPSMIITSLLFVLVHIPGWLVFMNYSWQHAISDAVYVFGISIIFSLLVNNSGSLYPSIIFHSIADIIAF